LHTLSVRFLFIQHIPVVEKEKERRQTDRRCTTRSSHDVQCIKYVNQVLCSLLFISL